MKRPKWMTDQKYGGLSDTGLLVIGLVVALVIILAIVIGAGLGQNHSDHVSCLRLHEQTGLETRYARSGWDGDCYIKVDGRWTPESRWRNLGGD